MKKCLEESKIGDQFRQNIYFVVWKEIPIIFFSQQDRSSATPEAKKVYGNVKCQDSTLGS